MAYRKKPAAATIAASLALFMVLLFPSALLSAQSGDRSDLPQYTGYVNDFANLIDSRHRQEITRVARAVKEATGAEIAVVTVPTIHPYGSIEEYSIALAEHWQVGERDKDNGVIILLAAQERRIRIEVGYGLEGAMPDGLVGEIMDKSMVPSFREDRYGEGFLSAVNGVAGIIAEEYNVTLSEVDMRESRRYESSRGSSGELLKFLIIFLILFSGGGRLFWPLLFMRGFSGRRYHRGGFGSGGFGSGGFGSGGGGFSGFGGGGFGGGGASRGF
jgi:uncharacterized protein